MTFKQLIKLSLISALMIPGTSRATHHPFQEFDPINMPKQTLTLKYAKLMTIEQSKILRIPQEELIGNPLFLGAFSQNISILSQDTQELEFSFQPGHMSPSVMIPAGFPLTAHNLFMRLTCGQITPQDLAIKEFGILNGKVQAGSQGQYEIGHWTSEMGETPASFVRKIHDTKRDFHIQIVTDLCARNQPLMNVIHDGLTRSNKELKGRDFIYPNLMEIYNFMHYIFGISVTENPSAGVRLSVGVAKNTIDLPTKRATAYEKGPLKRHLQGVLEGLARWGWSFDQANRSFVFNQA